MRKQTYEYGNPELEAGNMKAALTRIEAKLDAMIAALDGDDTEEPGTTLDGDHVGGERDQTQGLG